MAAALLGSELLQRRPGLTLAERVITKSNPPINIQYL